MCARWSRLRSRRVPAQVRIHVRYHPRRRLHTQAQMHVQTLSHTEAGHDTAKAPVESAAHEVHAMAMQQPDQASIASLVPASDEPGSRLRSPRGCGADDDRPAQRQCSPGPGPVVETHAAEDLPLQCPQVSAVDGSGAARRAGGGRSRTVSLARLPALRRVG